MRSLQALLALFACAFLPLHAADLDDLTWTTTDGEVTITDCDQAATGELVIPNTIDFNPVTSIGRTAFALCSRLTSITFGENSLLASIGVSAFHGCTSLTSITLPASITSIGGNAFWNCTELRQVHFEGGFANLWNERVFQRRPILHHLPRIAHHRGGSPRI